MSQIDELIAEHCPNGVPFLGITEVADYIRGITYSKGDEELNGPTRVLRANNITLSSNTLNLDNVKHVSESVKVRDNQRLCTGDILICAGSGSKDHIGKVAYIFEDMEETFGGFMGVIRSKGKLDNRYLFHLLTSDFFLGYLRGALSTTTINNLNSRIMKGFVIPVPPLEVQREIVRILDTFSKMEAELEAELETRKQQYEHYRRHIFLRSKNTDFLPLAEVCESISAGGDRPKDLIKGQTVPTEEMPYPIFSNGTGNSALYGFTNSFRISTPAVTISARGTIGAHAIREAQFTPIVRLLVLIPDGQKIDIRYLNYALDISEIGHSGGSIPQLTVPNVKKIEIPVPPMQEQVRIADALDKFDTLVNDLSIGLPAELAARRQQYEYYRDKLLTFRELEPAS